MAGIAELQALIKSPGGRRILERIMDEAPQVLKQFQRQPLAEAIERGGMRVENRTPLALMDPRDFERMAYPLGDDVMGLTGIGDKVRTLRRMIEPDVSNQTRFPGGLVDSNGVPYNQQGREQMVTDPGLDAVPMLQFESPYEGVLNTVAHDGRHRSRAITEMGQLDSLVQLPSRYRNQTSDVNEALLDDATDIYRQPQAGDIRLKQAGKVGDFFRLLGLGGLSALPATQGNE